MEINLFRKLRTFLKPGKVSNLSRLVKFNQRSTSQVSGFEFIKMLITQVGSGRKLCYGSLKDTLSNSNPDINISSQSLAKYFYKDASVVLIKTIYQQVFQYQKEQLLKIHNQEIDSGVFDRFNHIFIHDSTICCLDKRLNEKYSGSGGSASKASLKIDVIHELKTSAIVSLTVSKGNVHDVNFTSLDLTVAKKGDLFLRDLGYFKTKNLRELDERGAYFISRYKSDVKIYLSETGQPLHFQDILIKHSKRIPKGPIQVDVYLEPYKQKVRLIAYKVPEEVANKRRRQLHLTGKKQGWTHSEKRLALCDYVVLVTNIPLEMVSAEVIGTMYRLRWSIELMFKSWKFNLNLQLNLIKGTKTNRIDCFLYAMFIVCLPDGMHTQLVATKRERRNQLR